MKIYLTRYGQGNARIMSIDAEDKGFHWMCVKGSAKLELGADIFFIPELVSKQSSGTFLSMEEAVASLKKQIERDITGAQKAIQGLYSQLVGLKSLLGSTPASKIEE